MPFNFKCIFYSVPPLSLFIFPTMEISFILSIIPQANWGINIYPLPYLSNSCPKPWNIQIATWMFLVICHVMAQTRHTKWKLPTFPKARCHCHASDWGQVTTVLSRPWTDIWHVFVPHIPHEVSQRLSFYQLYVQILPLHCHRHSPVWINLSLVSPFLWLAVVQRTYIFWCPSELGLDYLVWPPANYLKFTMLWSVKWKLKIIDTDLMWE